MKRLLLSLLAALALPTAVNADLNYVKIKDLPSPPKPVKGPFSPFNRSEKYKDDTSPSGMKLYNYYKEDEYKGNYEWETLTITTELGNTEPETRRYMIRKKSIRLIDDWYLVDTLENHPNIFSVNTFEGTLHTGYGFLRPMKVNCKKGIVRRPKDFYTKFMLPSRRIGSRYERFKNYKGSNKYLTDSGWFLNQSQIDKGEVIFFGGNFQDVGQMRTSALYNYFCVGPKPF